MNQIDFNLPQWPASFDEATQCLQCGFFDVRDMRNADPVKIRFKTIKEAELKAGCNQSNTLIDNWHSSNRHQNSHTHYAIREEYEGIQIWRAKPITFTNGAKGGVPMRSP